MTNSRPRMRPGARTRLVAVLGLDLEQRQRQVLVRRVQVLDQQREHLLVRRREQVVTALAVLEPEDVRPVLGPAARRLVRLLGQQRREVHLLGAGGGHLLADDRLHLGQHAQAERQPGVDAGRGAADVPGAHEETVAGDLGVDRVLAQRAEEELGQADEHGTEPSSPGCVGPHGIRPCATMVPVPELPEVEALAQFLRGRTVDHTVTEVSVGAISALKTFRPPPDALVGGDGGRRAAARQVAGPHGRDAHRGAAAPGLAPVARGLGPLVGAAVHDPRPARASHRWPCGCGSTTARGST